MAEVDNQLLQSYMLCFLYKPQSCLMKIYGYNSLGYHQLVFLGIFTVYHSTSTLCGTGRNLFLLESS